MLQNFKVQFQILPLQLTLLDITKWVHWAGTFKRFLRRHDPLWPQILEKIEAKKGLAISKEVEDQMANEFWWVDMRAFKDQLFQGLECYTTGEAKKCVTAADESNVFSTWSRMADKGHSLRDDHVMDMQRKAYASKSPVAAKDLELAISVWEKEVSQFEEASGNTMEPKMRIIFLTDMCPLPLRQRIKDSGPSVSARTKRSELKRSTGWPITCTSQRESWP